MWIKLFLILAVILTGFAAVREEHHSPLSPKPSETIIKNNSMIPSIGYLFHNTATIKPLNEIKEMLHKEGLNSEVIDKVLITLKCAKNIEHNNILAVIDYSLPSNVKRLWVFDLANNKLLFNTYVSHGIKSGTLLSSYFSNKMNNKASSIGVYNTEQAYRGRYGTALKLDGLDKGFNDNAYRRFIVMHGAWYVDDNFIKKYGRAGRSWGCPAAPLNLIDAIVNTIKDKSLLVVYYPSNIWFTKSKFLNCEKISSAQNILSSEIEIKPPMQENDIREEILFADINNNNQREESEPILAISADNYQHIFNTKPPLNRMLRRQINHAEYIALTYAEYKNMSNHNAKDISANPIYFVIPNVKMQRGYFETEMRIISLGKIKEVRFNGAASVNSKPKIFTVYFDSRSPINLRTTNHFIRWLGL